MDTVSIDCRCVYAQLGSPDSPLLLDVRSDAAFEGDQRMIAGAVRERPSPRPSPKGEGVLVHPRGGEFFPPPWERVVTYCAQGHELSRQAAAALRASGHDAKYLEGGIEAWKAAGLPTLRKQPAWRVPGGSRWITRERPKIDRIACPWLIRRFIDPLAVFDYVPAASVFEEAEARSAVPYDIPGAVVTHRGERCSFDALLEDFDLHDAALDLLARIVRGADTNRLDLAPESSVLLATSLGLSKRFGDDHEMLEHAMPVYDGLHAWCRGTLAGKNEAHRWTPAA